MTLFNTVYMQACNQKWKSSIKAKYNAFKRSCFAKYTII